MEEDEKSSLNNLQAHLNEMQTPVPLAGDGENSPKKEPQQDESNSSGSTTSSSPCTTTSPKRDVGHTPSRSFKNARQGYRSPIKLYNPAQKRSNPPSLLWGPSSDAGVETPTKAFQRPTALAYPPKVLNQEYPKIPPQSPILTGSSELQHADKSLNFIRTTQTEEAFHKVGAAHVATSVTEKGGGDNDALWCEEVKKQETVPSDGEATQEGTKPILRTPPSLREATLLATTFAPHIRSIISPNGNEQQLLVPDFPDLQQMHMLDELSARGANFIGSKEFANDRSSVADDGASVNTRNEYWSVSSFHSKTQVIEKGIDLLDDTILPPSLESYEDFDLPVESLLKPMKKSTYNPIEQGDVQRFLADAGWKAESSTEQPKGGLWTEKKVPLQSVELGSSHTVDAATVKSSNTKKDQFLASVGKSVARGPFGQRREFFSTYMDGYTYTLSENRMATIDHVKKISTQSTNPPIWHRHRLEQQRAVLTTTVEPAKRTKREAPAVPSPPSAPAPRKAISKLKRIPLTAGLPGLL